MGWQGTSVLADVCGPHVSRHGCWLPGTSMPCLSTVSGLVVIDVASDLSSTS